MRILITTDVVGGVWTYSEELVDGLIERGHQVALVSFGGAPRAEHRSWLAGRPELDFTSLPYPLEWMREPGEALAASLAELDEVAARVQPDVIHLNQFFYGAYPLGAPALVVAHSDVWSWWVAVRGEDPPHEAWFQRYRGWVRAGLSGAAAVAAPSAWMAGRIRELYGTAAARVIHNARSAERFPPRPPSQRESLVMTAGRVWDEAKGVSDLVAAAERLGGRARVLIAGPTEAPDGGGDSRRESTAVSWAGAVPRHELASRLGRAAVYVATSRYEPFGLAPLEAALAGCALVLSEIPTFRELWDGCARFYPPGETDALADTLDELLREGGRRLDLARAARARALERFSPARMTAEYETVYAALVAGAAAPRPALQQR